jgi:hypothetical protein
MRLTYDVNYTFSSLLLSQLGFRSGFSEQFSFQLQERFSFYAITKVLALVM